MAALLTVAACYDDSDVLKRLDALEQVGYQNQLDALKSSVTALEAVDTEIKGTILDLQRTLENHDNEIDSWESATSDLQGQINILKDYDRTLESSIANLQALVEQSANDTKEWAGKTFATLEQYNGIVSDLNKLNDMLLDEVTTINSTITAKYNDLSNKIATSQAAIEDWVEATLEAYCTDKELDEELSALKTDLESLQTELDALEDRVSKLEQLTNGLSKEFTITFSKAKIATGPGMTFAVEYEIKGATSNTTVKAFAQNGWRTKVRASNESYGIILIIAPDPIVEDEIIVLVHDGEYRSIMTSINLVAGTFSPVISAQEMPAEGGEIKIDITTDIAYYDVSFSDDWLYSIETKTKAIITDKLLIGCRENLSSTPRTGTIELVDICGTIFHRFAIIQKGKDFLDVSAEETANCYIVSEDGVYKFKTTKGNSSESVGDVVSAEVLWESFGNDVKPNVGDLIPEVQYYDNYISFKAASDFKEGNAVIAAKDAEGTILWSWHIWLTDKPADQVYNNNAGTMMDRNLGATSATPGDVGALGLLYQWGRKDPFLGSSSISGGPKAASTIIWPSVVSSNSSNGTIDYATKYPTTFITCDNANNYWYYTGDETNGHTRWQSSKTIYDPCPPGYHVPDGGDNGILSTAFGTSSADFMRENYDDTNYGFNFGSSVSANKLTSTESTCWYPAAGSLYYNNGSLDTVGIWGFYWACSPRSSWHFCYPGDNGGPLGIDLGCAGGFSVRCQKIL